MVTRETNTIAFAAAGSTGRYGLSIVGSNPSRPLFVDHPPMNLTGENVTLAGLALLDNSASSVYYDGELDSSVIKSWQDAGVEVITRGKRAPLDRSRHTALLVSENFEISHSTPGRDTAALYVFPNDRFAGGLRGVKEIVACSNLNMFEGEARIRAMLALGILFAEDLMANTIVVPHLSEISGFERVAGLCDALELTLEGSHA